MAGYQSLYFFAVLLFSMYYYTIRTTLASQTGQNTPDGGPCNVLYTWPFSLWFYFHKFCESFLVKISTSIYSYS